MRQERASQIGSTATRDDRGDFVGTFGGGHKCRRGAGASPEISDLELACLRVLKEPIGRAHEPLGQEADIEAQSCCPQIDRLFLCRQQVDEQGRKPRLVEQLRDVAIARAEFGYCRCREQT